MRSSWVCVALGLFVGCGGRSELEQLESAPATTSGARGSTAAPHGGDAGRSHGGGGASFGGASGPANRGGTTHGGGSAGRGSTGGVGAGSGGGAGVVAGSPSGMGGASSGAGGIAGAAIGGGAGALGGKAGQAGGSELGGEAGAPTCVCAPAPPPSCVDATTLRRTDAGTCGAGSCVYTFQDVECLAGCLDAACAPFPVSIASGAADSCAVINGGPVKCWGGTFSGLIGDPNVNYVGPTTVPGLEQGVRKVSVGTSTACALTEDGTVKCWGGYFSTVSAVPGLPTGIVDIACGAPYFDHTCVITADATVECWGSNNFGQLGNGTTTASFTYQYDIANVTSLPAGASSIAAGSNDTCAITSGGRLSCWGMGRYGELGDGTFDSSSVPVPVTGFELGTLAVAAGEEYSCAITSLGAVRCWGWAADDGANNSAVPLDVAGVGRATAISADGAACAINSAGALKCWGVGGFNQLGNGSTNSNYTTAVDPVGMGAGVVAVAVGEYHACAVMETGEVKCWGSGPGRGNATPTVVDGF